MTSNKKGTPMSEFPSSSKPRKPSFQEDANKRAWGQPAREPLISDDHDNAQIIQVQKRIMNEQDEALDILADSVKRQKEIAIEIGKEADEHNQLLDEMDAKVDGTGARIRNATKKVMKVAEDSNTKGMWICICVLILALIVVAFLAIYL